MRQDFGLDSAEFNATTKNSLQVYLPARPFIRVIDAIHCSYGEVDPANNPFEAGRLMIVTGRFDVDRTQIDPRSTGTPSNFKNSVVYDVALVTADKEFYFGGRGFPLGADQDYTVILVRPATATDVWPLSAAMNGYLNVMGYGSGQEDPFGGKFR